MGRYYTMGSGREGKFAFGVQPSDDPEIFGMGQSHISYYLVADHESVENVKKVINEQYQILDVPKHERKFNFKDDDEKQTYLGELWRTKSVVLKERSEGDGIGYALDEIQEAKLKAEGKNPTDYTAYRVNPEAPLAYSRVCLGLMILQELEEEIEQNGESDFNSISLDAEL